MDEVSRKAWRDTITPILPLMKELAFSCYVPEEESLTFFTASGTQSQQLKQLQALSFAGVSLESRQELKLDAPNLQSVSY